LGKPQTRRSTLRIRRIVPRAVAVIAVMDVVPVAFFWKRDLDIGSTAGNR
jgi:hypothetical protein